MGVCISGSSLSGILNSKFEIHFSLSSVISNTCARYIPGGRFPGMDSFLIENIISDFTCKNSIR
ncbi:hypothetical protein LEP1GSC179_0053 [Leptospira santarosai str. MOR084]|uniref:Uncharacterized protein n=1 Tax=Leptospira santarosai str. MOR084 TaxID=1049984 RepID=A0A0E2BL89_9LEPT|nr:hypothetical protein LEP1GSC179_0053 [Leptospira santarosai str. MOR084]